MKKFQGKRIYTGRDYQAANALEKLYIHMVEPHRFPLNDVQAERLMRLKTAWGLIVREPHNKARIEAIVAAFDCDEKTAYRDMKEATTLFIETLDIDHELEMRISYQRLLDIAKKAEDEKEYDTARRCVSDAEDIRQKIENSATKDPKVYAAITITTNPAALAPRNVEDAEYLELETDATIPESEAVELLSGGDAL